MESHAKLSMVKRTRQSICAKKRRYAAEEDAVAAVMKASVVLRHYRCDRCGLFHLTGRTKGKFAQRHRYRQTTGCGMMSPQMDSDGAL